MPNLEGQIVRILGPMLLATMISCGLYGVLCVQAYTFYVTFTNERRVIKSLVHGYFMVETFQTILVIIDGFDLLVTNRGNILAIDEARLYWVSTSMIGGIVAGIGRLFFAYRLRIISSSWILPAPVIVLAMCATASQFVIAVQLFLSGKISSTFDDSFVPSLVAFVTSLICDFGIAGGIVYYLSRHRPITNPRLHHQVKRIIRLMIETGALMAAANTLSFIFFITFQGTTYFVVTYMMISKFYSNTTLLILNDRQTIPGGRSDISEGHGVVMWNTSLRLNSHTRSGPSHRGLKNNTLAFRHSSEGNESYSEDVEGRRALTESSAEDDIYSDHGKESQQPAKLT